MNREQRMRRIAAIKYTVAAEEEFDFSSIPLVSAAGQFGNHEIFRTDYNLNFDTQDLNEIFAQAANKEWITIPDQSRKLNIPHLYYLDPNKSTRHEKYFGAQTEYGYMDTPATAVLRHAAVRGAVPKHNMSEVEILEVPPEFRTKVGSDKLYTLDLAGEREVVSQSVNMMLRSKNRPELLRRLRGGPGREFEGTSSHSQGVFREPARKPIEDETLNLKLEQMQSSINKGLGAYQRLERVLQRNFPPGIIEGLMREQRRVNPQINFSGLSKDEYEDMTKQVLLRLIMQYFSDLLDSKIYEQDHTII